MDVTILENAALRVAVIADYGARVISLVDKATGRDWIYPGALSSNTTEDAVYAKDEAIGWDECFPTVSSFAAGGTPWNRNLRDHGDLWGRPWRVDSRGPEEFAATYVDPQFQFKRTLRLNGTTLIADYRVGNSSSDPLPYLWAQHNLLTVSPADRIVLVDPSRVTATFIAHRGRTVPTPSEFLWPGPDAGLTFPVDTVQPASTNLAAKLLVHAIPSRSVSLGHDGQWLTIGWENLDDLGIWLTYGGWHGVYHLALEPQSYFADHLGQAIERGAPPIPPNGQVSWRTTMTVSSARSPHED